MALAGEGAELDGIWCHSAITSSLEMVSSLVVAAAYAEGMQLGWCSYVPVPHTS